MRTLICSQLQEIPSVVIELSHQIIKEIIDKHILETGIPPHVKGLWRAVESFQRSSRIWQFWARMMFASG
jgi:hypothetical protein